MLKSILVIVFLAGILAIHAEDCIVAGAGAPAYRIVIPAQTGTPIDHFMKTAAELLQEGIEKSTGARLPIVHEDQANSSTPAFYLGKTASSPGTDDLGKWESHFKCDASGNIYIRGRDIAAPGQEKSTNHRYYELGSLRGVCEFLREYTGMRVSLPNNTQRYYTAHKQIKLQKNASRKITPDFIYCNGRPSANAIYDIANNFLPAPWYKSYGGHSWPAAVPQEMYDKHPEYFTMTAAGKRWKGSQYCISNPEFQELVYQEMLKSLDMGYEWVQLAQNDGFGLCKCKPCQELYQTSDAGEKVWIFHRNLAERLLHDRPGQKVVILSYNPTQKPPATFKKFPPNTIIEICRYSEDELKSWSGYEVPGGFTVYVYNWGVYSPEGFSPKFNPAKAITQIELFKRHGINAVYRCGFGEIYGLEGPDYYAYGQAMLGRSGADALLNEYCKDVFGAASETMAKFYTLLYSRQTLILDEKHDDYYRRLNNNMPGGFANYQLYHKRYPQEILSELDGLLRQAESMAPDRRIMKLVRLEFDSMSLTARMASILLEYLKTPDRQHMETLRQAVVKRDGFINALSHKKDKNLPDQVAGLPLLGRQSLETIRRNGSWKASMFYPLNWDFQYLLDNEIYPGGRILTANDTFQYLLPVDFNPEAPRELISVKAKRDGANLVISFKSPQAENKDMFFIYLNDCRYNFRPGSKTAFVNRQTDSNPQTGAINYRKDDNSPSAQVSRNSEIVSLTIPCPKSQELNVNFYYTHESPKGRFNYVWEPDLKEFNGRHTASNGRGKLQ